MKNKFTILLILILGLGGYSMNAQKKDNNRLFPGEVYLKKEKNFKKSYFSYGFEGNIFSTSIFERPGRAAAASTLRYTAFFHAGYMYNYNFSNNAGLLTGLSLKNIGFIDKYPNLDSTVKRRLYTFNLPVGIKLGNMTENKFFFAGAEASLAVNYKEKGFVKRNNKTKFNEWFSDRTPLIMPNVFVGYQQDYFYFKLSYYPTNFLNTDFVDNTGNKPYAGYNVNIIAVTIGSNLPTKPKYD